MVNEIKKIVYKRNGETTLDAKDRIDMLHKEPNYNYNSWIANFFLSGKKSLPSLNYNNNLVLYVAGPSDVNTGR